LQYDKLNLIITYLYIYVYDDNYDKFSNFKSFDVPFSTDIDMKALSDY